MCVCVCAHAHTHTSQNNLVGIVSLYRVGLWDQTQFVILYGKNLYLLSKGSWGSPQVSFQAALFHLTAHRNLGLSTQVSLRSVF